MRGAGFHLPPLDATVYQRAAASLVARAPRVSAHSSAALCRLLAEMVRVNTQQWPYPRHALATWGLRADARTASPLLAALLDRLPVQSAWRNAAEQFADTLAFRRAMQEELLP